MSLPTSPRRGRGFDRKTMQLCKHVERELNQVLSGECDDDVLRELMVVDVQPLDGAAQLMVIVQPYDLSKPPDRFLILKKLNAVKGKLRFAIGETISRRKVPDLVFRISGISEEIQARYQAMEAAGLPVDGSPESATTTDVSAEADDGQTEIDELHSDVDAVADIEELTDEEDQV